MYSFSSDVSCHVLWESMPFLQAATAARCGPVLGDKDRVVSHWRLLAVIRGVGGGRDVPR